MSDEDLLTTFRTLLAPAPELAAPIGTLSAPSPSSTTGLQSPAVAHTQRAQALPSPGADRSGGNSVGTSQSPAQNSSAAPATGLGQSLSDTGAAIRRRLPFLPSPESMGSNGGGVQQAEAPPAVASVAPAAEPPAVPSRLRAEAAQGIGAGKSGQPADSRQSTLPRAPDGPSPSSAAPSEQRPRSAVGSAPASVPGRPPAADEEADRTADLLATLGAPVPPDNPADAAVQRDDTEGDFTSMFMNLRSLSLL